MALTKEDLKGIEGLKGLTDEQLGAIATLSENNEAAVIATKYKTLFDEYDTAIKEITGKEKPREKKTIEFLRDTLKETKEAADKATGPLQKKIEALTGERDELKRKIETGAADEGLRKEYENLKVELGDKNVRVSQLEKDLQAEREKAAQELKRAQEATIGLRLDHEFQKGLSGVRFKDEKLIPVKVRETFIETAKERLRGKYKPDFIKEGEQEVMIFRDEKGMVVSNPKNLQKPYSPGELLLAEIQDILDPGKQQPGTGTGAGAGTTNGFLDISGAKSRTEATTLIRKYLAEQGIPAGSPEFAKKAAELYTENKVEALPMK